jgi:hypothetical protein
MSSRARVRRRDLGVFISGRGGMRVLDLMLEFPISGVDVVAYLSISSSNGNFF